MKNNFRYRSNSFSGKIKWILIAISIAMILFVIFIFAQTISMRRNGYVMISEPSYGEGNYSNSYWTKEYKEENGCISFVDEYGVFHKICGSYHIK